MRLSICIPTVIGREEKFDHLYTYIKAQIVKNNLEKDIEIISEKDNKEMSIGKKRDILYNRAKGVFSVQVDDDDWLDSNYIAEVYTRLNANDCVGYIEHCTINGEESLSKISIECKEWKELQPHQNSKFKYFRTPFFKTPIRTELCKRVGVNDMRYSEDHDFSKRIFPFLMTESFINKPMYFYSANSLTREQHNLRYGIVQPKR